MKPTIDKLYNGELRPCERAVKNHDYWELRGNILRHKNTFIQMLEEQAPNLSARFASLMDDLGLMHTMEMEDMFGYGFSLAMKLSAEATHL